MKILLIQLKQLGDVLLSTPIAENIKIFYPNATVHFLTSENARDILTENPYIDKIITLRSGIKYEFKTIFTLRKELYYAVLDVQRTGRSKRITLLSKAKIKAAFKTSKDSFYYNTLIQQHTKGYTAFERLDILKAIGITKPKKVMPKLFFSKKTEDEINSYLKRYKISDFFIVSPTARKPSKMWQPEEFGKLSNILSKKLNIKAIVVFGTESEKIIAQRCAHYIENSHLIEKPFPIKNFAALVSKAKFSLGNDSFASHVAVSQNVKTVVICGPTSGWFPKNNKKILSIYKGLKCQPCNNPKKCLYDFACYKSLNHKEIVSIIENFLKD